MSLSDLQLLYETFQVFKNSSLYRNSPVQQGFRQVFAEADRDNDGFVERHDFPPLIDGYFNSKHVKAGAGGYEEYFRRIDLN